MAEKSFSRGLQVTLWHVVVRDKQNYIKTKTLAKTTLKDGGNINKPWEISDRYIYIYVIIIILAYIVIVKMSNLTLKPFMTFAV